MERHADASSVVGLEVRGRCVLPWLKKLEATSPQLNLSPSHHPEPRPKRPCRVCPNWPIYVKIGSTISRLIKPRDANSERRKKTYLKRRKKATRFWRNLVFQKVRYRKCKHDDHTFTNRIRLNNCQKCFPILFCIPILLFHLAPIWYLYLFSFGNEISLSKNYGQLCFCGPFEKDAFHQNGLSL